MNLNVFLHEPPTGDITRISPVVTFTSKKYGDFETRITFAWNSKSELWERIKYSKFFFEQALAARVPEFVHLMFDCYGNEYTLDSGVVSKYIADSDSYVKIDEINFNELLDQMCLITYPLPKDNYE